MVYYWVYKNLKKEPRDSIQKIAIKFPQVWKASPWLTSFILWTHLGTGRFIYHAECPRENKGSYRDNLSFLEYFCPWAWYLVNSGCKYSHTRGMTTLYRLPFLLNYTASFKEKRERLPCRDNGLSQQWLLPSAIQMWQGGRRGKKASFSYDQLSLHKIAQFS